MRLTLRTLLAYLDDVLSPQDSKALAEKIEKNEFAAGIVKRVQAAMHRKSLGAPDLDVKELGIDTNLVAEYLDSTLPPEKMPDLEKSCLESDVYLAEVAACHQILTLVLGEPAAVDPSLKERAYKIGRGEATVSTPPATATTDAEPPQKTEPAGKSAADHAGSNGAATAIPTPKAMQPTQTTPEPKPKHEDQGESERLREVPEYLRESRPPRIWPLVITVAATFLIALGVMRIFGPFDSSHPMVAWLSGQDDQQVAMNTEDSAVESDNKKPPKQSNVNPADEDDAAIPDNNPSPPESDDPIIEPGNPPGEGAIAGSSGQPQPPTIPTGDGEPNVEDPADMGDPDMIAAVDPVDPAEPMPMTPTEVGGADGEEVAMVDPEDPALEPPAASVDVGRFTSDAEALALYQPDKQIWIRLPSRAPLVSGTRLCALPTYRPQMTLAGGVQVTLIGPTQIEILTPGEDGTPVIRLEYGRMVAITVGKPGAKLNLEVAGKLRTITFADADSTAGIEMRRYLPPGANPMETARMFPLEVFVSSGSIQVESTDGLIVAKQNQVIESLGDNPLQVAEAPTPAWMSGRDVRDIERRASRTLEELLPPDKALGISLLESAEDRRSEVRALAVDSLGYLGQYEPLISAVGDDDQRTFWPDHYDALRDAISKDRETAAALLIAATKVRGAEAEQLLRFLWGYAPEELAAGEAAKLVAMLDNDSLDNRVLAFESLRRITGATHTYRPEQSETRRRTPLNQWRDRLERGEITYVNAPRIFPLRTKVDIAAPVEPAVVPLEPAPEGPEVDPAPAEEPAKPPTDEEPATEPAEVAPANDLRP
jgi:hypothetical protein